VSSRSRFVDLTERIIYLRSIPVAAGLPPEVLHVIASNMRERTFPAGATILREGDPLDEMHLFTAGAVRLRKQGKDVGVLRPPQSLGFLGILANGESPYDAVVETEAQSLELGADALFEVMEDHFSLAHSSIQYVSERLLAELLEMPAEGLGIPFKDVPLPEHPLDLVDRILFLRSLKAFERGNVNALAVMSNSVTERRFADGEPLWRSGEQSERVLLIVSGRVACHAPDGRKWAFGPKTVVGGPEALSRKPHWYDASSQGATVALEQSTNKLLDVFEENFALTRDFLIVISGLLQGLLDRKMAAGQSSIAVPRNVSALGAVPVGA